MPISSSGCRPETIWNAEEALLRAQDNFPKSAATAAAGAPGNTVLCTASCRRALHIIAATRMPSAMVHMIASK